MTSKEQILNALVGGQPAITLVAVDYTGFYLAGRTERAYVTAYRDRLDLLIRSARDGVPGRRA